MLQITFSAHINYYVQSLEINHILGNYSRTDSTDNACLNENFMYSRVINDFYLCIPCNTDVKVKLGKFH